MAKSITSRKVDLLYLVFFIIHLPVMLSRSIKVVDLVPFYPASLAPTFSLQLRQFYISTYRDQFLIGPPPAWFTAYTVLEMVYHLPLTLWAIPALLRDDPRIKLHLLVFALEVGMTTFTCVVDMWNWEGYTGEEKKKLAGVYVPYLALAVGMGVDMFLRLQRAVRVDQERRDGVAQKKGM